MNKHILMAVILAVLAACARATDTNRLILDSEALAALAAAGNAGGVLPMIGTPTNKSAWSGTLAAGLTLTSGNSDTVLASTTLNVHRADATNEWNLGGDAAYGENSGVENNETLHGFVQYDHFFTPRWFGYTRADALHDGIADVVYRATLSPGIGYYFIKTKRTMLSCESGPGAVLEKLDGDREYYTTARVAERFERKIDDNTRIWDSLELLPQVDRPDNFLVNAEVGVEAAITKKISLRTVLQDNFANEPAPDHKNNDVRLVSGFGYKF
jgi:putative salt-induced outer membrane protein YdiY